MLKTAEQPKSAKRTAMNQYLLFGDKRNESWQIRTNNVFVTIGGKRRQLRYCEGESSIFKDEQHQESKPTYLWLELGSLLVSPNDKVRNQYIQAHPDFNVKFYLYDEESESIHLLEKLEEEDDVRALLRQLNNDQKEAVATVIYGMNVVSRWKQAKIKLELLNMVKSNPTKLKNVMRDPATELIYLAAGAIKLGIIRVAPDKTSIQWVETGIEIIPIPRGVNPLQELSAFLRTDDAITTLQAIGDKVNEKKGIKVTRNTKKKK